MTRTHFTLDLRPKQQPPVPIKHHATDMPQQLAVIGDLAQQLESQPRILPAKGMWDVGVVETLKMVTSMLMVWMILSI